MCPEPIFDPRDFDVSKPLYTREQIRAFNEQRFEMEMLDGVLLHDVDRQLIVGFLHLRKDDWWARGHFPNRPMLPGVLGLEAAGQLCSVYFHRVAKGLRMGLAKIDEVRFYVPMEPPGTLFLAGRLKSHKLRFASFEVQGILNGQVTFHSHFTGAAI
jgi:3-hydroxyacyl-[acyl-carrier-protein] dehydratase